MFRRLFVLIFFVFLIQGVIASPQDSSLRIRGGVYLDKLVYCEEKLPLSGFLFVRKDSSIKNADLWERLKGIYIDLPEDSVTVLSADYIKEILRERGVVFDVLVGRRVICIPKLYRNIGNVIERMTDSIDRVYGNFNRYSMRFVDENSLFSLQELQDINKVETNFVVLNRKMGNGLVYLNYVSGNDVTRTEKFLIHVNTKGKRDNGDYLSVHTPNIQTGDGSFPSGNGFEDRGIMKDILVRGGSRVRIIFVKGAIVVKTSGYCFGIGKFGYNDYVKVRSSSGGRYFTGKVIGKGEVLVEIK